MRKTFGFRNKTVGLHHVIRRLQSVANSFPKTPEGLAVAAGFRSRAESLKARLAKKADGG
jgi:hypothetical protein